MNGMDSQERLCVHRVGLLGRLTLADGKTKHLHLAIKASHWTDPTKSKTLLDRQQQQRGTGPSCLMTGKTHLPGNMWLSSAGVRVGTVLGTRLRVRVGTVDLGLCSATGCDT